MAIVGNNGHGKTNLLEAIAYLHLLRSARGARDLDVARFGTSGFYVRGEACGAVASRPAQPLTSTSARDEAAPRSVTVGVGFERSTRRKRVLLNESPPERLSDALGAVPSVTFSPADVELVRGGPVGRRRYLDVVLATTSRRYLMALQSYRHALRQRNAALRDLARRTATLGAVSTAVSPWEAPLAAAGAALWAERRAWAVERTPELAELCRAIGEHETVELRHAARLPGAQSIDGGSVRELEQRFAATLDSARAGDYRFGATRFGPHRDDLIITLAGRELRVFGSAGQQRSVAIALRILESHTLRDYTGSSPVLLLDDPFAELDVGRTRASLGLLGREGMGQVVVAVPRSSDIPPELTRLQRHAIAGGVVTPMGGTV